MQRWHLTFGLAAAALAAFALAPRLVPRVALPDLAPPPPPGAPAPAAGSLGLTWGLDHPVLLAGRAQDRMLVVELAGPDTPPAELERPPVDLAVVLDASGSMSADGKMDRARDGARYLLSELAPRDSFALVAFADRASTVVPLAPVIDRTRASFAIDRLAEGGGTNLGDGLDLAGSELAGGSPRDTRRLVLLSDGQANVGVLDPDALVRQVARLAAGGVTVSTIGLGADFNEDLLARMADAGGGSFDYVAGPAELHAALADELAREQAWVARGARVHVAPAPGVTVVEVLGWEAARAPDGGVDVFVGDVHAGETRQIVLRIGVSAPAGPTADLAGVTATWDDLIEGGPGRRDARATAGVSADPAEADRTDPARATMAAAAWGNSRILEADRAFRGGRGADAHRLYGEARGVLEVAARTWGSADLAEDARRAARQDALVGAQSPDSPVARDALKTSQELSRARAK